MDSQEIRTEDFTDARKSMKSFGVEVASDGTGYCEIDSEGIVWLYEEDGRPMCCMSLETYRSIMGEETP